MVGVLLAEPNCLLRLGFRSVLANDASVAITAEAVDELQLFRAFAAMPHEVVLISLALLQDIGLKALNQLRQARPSSRLLVHSYDTDVAFAAEALRFGASGFLSNHAGVAELGVAISTVASGQAYIAEQMGEELARRVCFHPSYVERIVLTALESRVARMLSIGMEERSIAVQLGITPISVAVLRARILKKMDGPAMDQLLSCAIAKSVKTKKSSLDALEGSARASFPHRPAGPSS
jgi:DNA-binding NarL/FixJ family response regulator